MNDRTQSLQARLTDEESKQANPSGRALHTRLVKGVAKFAHLSAERGQGEQQEEYDGERKGYCDERWCGRSRSRKQVGGIAREYGEI